MARKMSKLVAIAMAAQCKIWLEELEAGPGHAEMIARPISGYFARARVRAWKRRIAHYDRISREG